MPSALCFLFALIVRDFPGITQDIYGTCTGRPQENFLIQTLNHLIWLNVKEQGFYSNFLLDACESIPVSKTEPRHHMEYFDYRYLQSHLLLPVGVGGYNTFTQYFFLQPTMQDIHWANTQCCTEKQVQLHPLSWQWHTSHTHTHRKKCPKE